MKNFSVTDIKPKNAGVVDIKSSVLMPSMETEIYRDPHVLTAGMPIGLLLTLTYWTGAGTAQHIRD